MTISPATTTRKIIDILRATPNTTAADIAAATGLGRSTVSKQLAQLEGARQVNRTPGDRQDGRRAPDRWNLVAVDPKAARDGRERLRPGQLDALVLDHVANQTEPTGPVAVARALGRSSGAVANCLARLTTAGQLRQVSDRPRRYNTK
jgi:DNA-binding IclR family transcriptional regulator